eukprot:6176047-Pleurochrysis_carterae.AAC.1
MCPSALCASRVRRAVVSVCRSWNVDKSQRWQRRRSRAGARGSMAACTAVLDPVSLRVWANGFKMEVKVAHSYDAVQAKDLRLDVDFGAGNAIGLDTCWGLEGAPSEHVTRFSARLSPAVADAIDGNEHVVSCIGSGNYRNPQVACRTPSLPPMLPSPQPPSPPPPPPPLCRASTSLESIGWTGHHQFQLRAVLEPWDASFIAAISFVAADELVPLHGGTKVLKLINGRLVGIDTEKIE